VEAASSPTAVRVLAGLVLTSYIRESATLGRSLRQISKRTYRKPSATTTSSSVSLEAVGCHASSSPRRYRSGAK
jgi:hypothetical protein